MGLLLPLLPMEDSAMLPPPRPPGPPKPHPYDDSCSSKGKGGGGGGLALVDRCRDLRITLPRKQVGHRRRGE